MRAKELQDWFPEARISDQPVEKEGYLTLPLASQQWILLEEAGLSEREKQLVALLTQQEQARSLNPWYSYLVEGKGQALQVFKKDSVGLLPSFLFSAGKSGFLARYDADSFSELSDSATGRSSGLCFRASTRQIHFCKRYFK